MELRFEQFGSNDKATSGRTSDFLKTLGTPWFIWEFHSWTYIDSSGNPGSGRWATDNARVRSLSNNVFRGKHSEEGAWQNTFSNSIVALSHSFMISEITWWKNARDHVMIDKRVWLDHILDIFEIFSFLLKAHTQFHVSHWMSMHSARWVKWLWNWRVENWAICSSAHSFGRALRCARSFARSLPSSWERGFYLRNERVDFISFEPTVDRFVMA